MAVEADQVVVELIAKTDAFDAAIKQSAQTFDNSMKQIEGASSKSEKTVSSGSAKRSGALKNEAKEISAFSGALKDQLTDMSGFLTGGKSPFEIIPKQAPGVTNAMRAVSVASGLLGGVLGGLLAAAATAAGAALIKLAIDSKGLEGRLEDLVEKLKENAQKAHESEIASDIFATTLEGVTQAIREDEKALDKLNDAHKTAASIMLEQQRLRMNQLKGLKDEAEATLAAARAQIELNRARTNVAGNDPRISGPLNAASDAAEARIKEAETALKRIDSIIVKQEGRVAQALSRRIVELVATAADPVDKINKKYDDLIEQARQRAVAEGTVTTKLAAQTREYEKQRAAALEAEEAKKRAAAAEERAGRQSGRQITEADARRIVAGIGGTVTSGFRTPAHNEKVGGVANSFHTKGQAIDIAKTAGLTLAKIVQAFEAQGVKLIEKLDEGDHFHVAFGRRGAGGPSQETLAKRALAEADAAARREQAFQNEKASLQDDEIAARQALIDSAEEIANLELQSIEISRAKYEDQVKSLVETRKLQANEAEELLKLNDERARLRAELVKRREDERKFRLAEQQAQNELALKTAQLQNEADILQSQQGLTTTRKERAAIERRLLDIQFEEERLALEAIINHNERLKTQKGILESERIEAEAAAQIAKTKLESLGQRQANAQAGGDRANASPLNQYFDDLKTQAGDINDAFESIAAGGLATFTDGLTDAILGFRSFGDVGRQVLGQVAAGLVKLAIQQVILATIGKALGKGAVAASSAEGTAVAAAWAPAAANVALATLGAAAGPAAAALVGTHALSAALSAAAGFSGAAGKAQGGRIFGKGSSTSDDVPIWASNDEFMIRARSARSLGYDTLEHINRTGKLPGFAEGGRVRTVRPSNDAALPASGGGGFAPQDINSLRGIIGEAVAAGVGAMPDVALYASLDPADMLQRALGTPAGQKALVAAIGKNGTRVKSVIR